MAVDSLNLAFWFALRSGIEQLAFIKLRDRRPFLDFRVKIGLCERRFVAFVVAIAAIAIQVDHYVSPELLAEIERQIADKLHCERVIAVHMKNRCLDYFGDIRGVTR